MLDPQAVMEREKLDAEMKRMREKVKRNAVLNATTTDDTDSEEAPASMAEEDEKPTDSEVSDSFVGNNIVPEEQKPATPQMLFVGRNSKQTQEQKSEN